MLAPTLAVRAGWGHYYQAPNFASLFERFKREIEWNLFETIRLEPERAVHYLAGVEWLPGPGYTVKLEGYYKQLDELVVATDSTYNYIPNNTGEGFASGVEVFLQKRPSRQARLAGWVSYSYGATEERDPAQPAPARLHQRHANVVASRAWAAVEPGRATLRQRFSVTPVMHGQARFDERARWSGDRAASQYQRLDLRFAWTTATRGASECTSSLPEIINVLTAKRLRLLINDDYSKRGSAICCRPSLGTRQ